MNIQSIPFSKICSIALYSKYFRKTLHLYIENFPAKTYGFPQLWKFPGGYLFMYIYIYTHMLEKTSHQLNFKIWFYIQLYSTACVNTHIYLCIWTIIKVILYPDSLPMIWSMIWDSRYLGSQRTSFALPDTLKCVFPIQYIPDGVWKWGIPPEWPFYAIPAGKMMNQWI